MGAPAWNDRPHSLPNILSTVCDFADYRHGKMAPWLVELLRFLAEHEAECPQYYVDFPHRSFSWVRYHEAPYGSLPSNFVAVGDAVMKLNPAGGESHHGPAGS